MALSLCPLLAARCFAMHSSIWALEVSTGRAEGASSANAGIDAPASEAAIMSFAMLFILKSPRVLLEDQDPRLWRVVVPIVQTRRPPSVHSYPGGEIPESDSGMGVPPTGLSVPETGQDAAMGQKSLRGLTSKE